jgi:hypothetical protein
MFKRFKQFAAVATVAVVAGLGSAQSASAGIAPEPVTVNLDSLLAGGANEGGITLGDKHYDNFDFSSAGQNPLTAKDVEVVIALDGNQHFISFLMDLSSIGTARTDLVISYDLHVLDPARHINSVGLSFDGAPLDAGEFGPVAAGVILPTRAAASVTETVSTLDGSDLAPGGPVQSSEIITVFNDGDGADTLPDNLDKTLAVNPTRGLHFVKDILVSSRGEGAALITFVENSVTQNGTTIPLPAAFWAAMPVLGGLVGGKKVRRLFARA